MSQVLLFVSLHLCFVLGSAPVRPTSPPRNQQWLLSCFNCSGLDPVWRVPGLDPVAGCDSCRDNGPATSLHGVVRIHSDHHAYATYTNIALLALTDFDDPKEFLWYFGDSRSTRSHSGATSTKYQTPGRYDVFVIVSLGWTFFTSEVFPLVVQTPVRLNRLVHQASILRNQTLAVSCRVNSGTDLVYTWRFGDGTWKSGGQREQHVFHRIGEFTIEVMVSNLVSSASLLSQVFVVDRPCQPPSVKNMGPHRIQMRRFEVTHLGVTSDAEIDCDHAAGLSYSWQLFDSAGGLVPLTNTHQQSLTVPRYLLQCDTYTAVARVAVIGSVVYSNYSVTLEVVPSSPVASIQGATNILVTKWKSDMVVLDGRESHNPDYPGTPLSFTWTCEPVSSIKTSCFNQHVNTSSPLLQFPVNSLKGNFDQFHVTLTVHSGERWASSEVFVSLTSQSVRRMTVHCPECQGGQVNWDQSFTVISGCMDCDVSSENVQYTWNLYTVNASTKPVFEVPFCYLAQLGAPSHFVEGSTTTRTTPGPPPTAESSLHTGNGIFTPPLEEFSHMEPLNLHLHQDDRLFGRSEDARGFRFDSESSADWNFDYAAAEIVDLGEGLYYGVSNPVTEEGDPGKSPGRPMGIFSPIAMSNEFNYDLFFLPGVDGEILIPGDDLHFSLVSHDNEGSNLVDSSRAAVIQKPTLLDLPRVPVDQQLLESFTHSGASSSALSFRPFSLKQSSRYMLQVTATSSGSLLGRAQIFLVAKPAPRGMTCQVQPSVGTELYTQFSIFCASGRADLVYEYSYSVGAQPAEMMYQGTDFQYFFHLPSGDASNDYRVTIYTKIRSSLFGTSTKVCPVDVQVQPSFVRAMTSADPESELSTLGIETLTALVKLGNKAEIRNYIRLLTNILNSPDGPNIGTQRLHSVLVCTMCDLGADSQASMLDNISVLRDLLRVSSQVTMMSVKRVTAHIQTVSLRFSDPTGPSLYNLDQQMLRTLLTLLSYSMQAANARYIPKSAEITHDIILETFIQKERATDVSHDNGCTKFPSVVSMKTRKRIVSDVLRLASELIVMYVSLLKAREHRITAGGMFFYAALLNQSFSTLSCSSCSLYMPTSLTHFLLDREECVVSLLTEITHSPYTWARYPPEMSAPVIDLSLYKCRTRNKISVRALVEPITIEVHRPERDHETSMYELLRGSISYHSFNITQKQLRQSIQLRLRFSPAANKPFPVMLLFRMYERPTPSVYHQQKFYLWKSLSAYITFPPSYFNAAGLGYLALLNANFKRPLRNHHLNRQINYSLEVVTSQCLSWDEPRDLWTHDGCRTHQTEATAAVNCSCFHLRPLTVAQEQILSLYETAELDPFLSVSSDLTIASVLLVVVCLFVPILVMCRRADLISKDDQRLHYLADNSSWDSHLYAVTIHTGLRSSARLSAKVFIVLYGEDGVSQTRELRVPGCTLFGKNSQNTFILSVSDHLGPVRGVHIWHDNSGPSPFWYIKLIEVAEVTRQYVKQQTWLFVCQCWLAVHQGDGQVERRLRSTGGVSLAQMLRLRLSDYLSDYHIWMSVYSHPRPSTFTHTQRLGLCLLLLLGYAGANTVAISQTNELLLSDLGFVCVSWLAVRTGFLSVMAVLPVATLVHFFFRRCAVKNERNSQDSIIMSGQANEDHHVWLNLQKQDTDNLAYSVSLKELEKDGSENEIFKKTNCPMQRDDRTSLSGSNVFQKSHSISNTGGIVDTWKTTEQFDCRSEADVISEKKKDSLWFHCFAWTLCLLLSLHCFLISAVLGSSFSEGKVLLWIQSFFFSLLFCIFLIQPALILAVTVAVCLNHKIFGVTELETLSLTSVEKFHFTLLPERPQTFEKLLGARRRARYLQLVRPPSQMELRNARARKTRETRIGDTLRDLSVCVAMIMTLVNSSNSSSVSDQQQLNRMIQQQLTRAMDGRIQTDADWWEWAQNQLLDVMYNNNSATEPSHRILIGKPSLQKMEILRSFQCQVLRLTVGLPGHEGCEQSETVHLGHTRTEAAHKLKVLELRSWLGEGSVDIKVQFTFFSPAPNLFTTVNSVAERRLTGVSLPPAKVQSVQLHHCPALHDYGVMVCQIVFVVVSLLHLWRQIHAAGQEGLIRYCKSPWNWLELIVLLVALLYVVRRMDHSSLLKDVVDLMQRHQYREHVDVSQLATREQEIQSLRGILLFLLVVKCLTVVKVNKTSAPHVTFTKRLLSVISSCILLVAISIIRSLLSSGQNPEISGSKFLHYRALSLTSAVLLSTLTMTFSSIKKAKPPRGRAGVCTAAELVHYFRRRVRELTGGPPQTDVDVKTYYLEEFDCLLDQLLFRLNSLYYTLPGPSLTPEPVSVDSQSWTEASLTSDHADAQELRLNKKGTDGEDSSWKGRTDPVQEGDLIGGGVSSQSFKPTLHRSQMSPNCVIENPHCIEEDRPTTRSVGNVLVEVVVHQEP
ncbi:LOW QUALITY PROTEIN: polycystin-1-like protein 1 [Neosynchiropus ocellatus]